MARIGMTFGKAGPNPMLSKRPIVAPPLFIKSKDLPKDVRNIEILKQAELIAGSGKARVAQKINGLWRLHMVDTAARNKVYGHGMKIRGSAIEIFNENPHQFTDSEGRIVEGKK